MKSPFPGMDPYLERHWPGVHTHLASAAAGQLNQVLPSDLVALTEERLAIQSAEDEDARAGWADVMVYQPKGTDTSEGGVAVSAPYKLIADAEPITERFVQILRVTDRRLITVIEFISPANKTGQGLEQFRRKRRELGESGVHVVEIDLTRRGNWRALLRPHLCPAEAVSPYRVTTRIGGSNAVYLYPIRLREPLPSVSVPLRPEDSELKLRLQPLIEHAYQVGGYSRVIDYGQPADPPLEADDATWVGELVRAAR